MKIPQVLSESGARTAIVLGSGLGSFADGLEQACSFAFAELGLPSSKVPGHAGRLILARFNDRPLLIAQGRIHLYEGWQAEDIGRTIVFMHRIGIEKLILTNAAGSLNPNFEPGSWMMLSDHINFTGQSPLRGAPHFIDMSEVYSHRLRQCFRNAAARQKKILHEGVYAAVQGPQYETPAEVRMLQRLGADAVGMSTVPEAIQARALGLEVAGFSCLTNWGACITNQPISHNEISGVGEMTSRLLIEIFRQAILEF